MNLFKMTPYNKCTILKSLYAILNILKTSHKHGIKITLKDYWLGNGRPPWAAYRALMSGRVIVLDKQPRLRPVGVGETWRRLMTRCLLWVVGLEAKAACRTTHLVGGVEAGIEGAIHSMCFLWEEHAQEEGWGFLFIDARNALNEENWTAMLWAVWNEWPSGAQFIFN